ncbi:MAG TPA: septal ring lytic transglycosylase RlpA family protein [Stellaceae bacterium]|nr:septal ring lytic transglycosylase RlpA family protein [Stellaceae bacterium]
MQIRRLGFFIYWSAVVSLVSMIDSGVSADANISGNIGVAAANSVVAAIPAVTAAAPEAAAPDAVQLVEAQPGGLDAVQAADQVGIASWYGNQHQGRLTASGERFDERKLTAAHRTLPLDTKLKVTNLENGKSVEVKVNDRGPYIAGRVLDLSTQAAKMLGMDKEGLALVRIEIVQQQVAVVD